MIAGFPLPLALHAPEPDQVGASRDRLDDVSATAERAIDHHLCATGHRIDDFRGPPSNRGRGRAAAAVFET
jgi:hypothetical protein